MLDDFVTVCEQNQCAGCMACVDVCAKDAITVVDEEEYMNAVINPFLCINCGVCHKICQKNNPAEMKTPIKWCQGWADSETRATSSSGGFGQELMRTAFRAGWTVAACKFSNGEFKFDLLEDETEVLNFTGSKYVKSNPRGIYNLVKEKLQAEKKVLFIGLPCQVSAMRNYVKDDINLYTVDLICHGSPSQQLLKKAVNERGVDLSQIKEISFRHADRFALETKPVSIVPEGVQDRYTLSFLKGICYTENCYSCEYAQTKRVGDISIGDSWGTEMTSELAKGISLVMCQTGKGQQLLDMINFNFFDVDIKTSIQRNNQLQYPSPMPKERMHFFDDMKKGKSFSATVMRAYPKECLKQNVKELLIKMHIWTRK